VRFLVDESTGPEVAGWLRELGHDARSVYEQMRGKSDQEILNKGVQDRRIIITNDKDFGEMIYREGHQHVGVILLRLGDERTQQKIAALDRLLSAYSDRLEGNFVVVTERRIRISKGG
jgi:predicted nuclease of predicted toxin-antitoxin system